MPILIVEDNVVSAKLAECLLQKAGYQTVVVKNGNEALAVLPTINNLDLIITDFMMPEMDGLERIAKIKGLSTFRDIPIIILSARCGATTVRAARGLDCEGFLVKPVGKNQLLERVGQILRDQPLVLRDKTHIMDSLQIDAEEYHDLAGMLSGPGEYRAADCGVGASGIRRAAFPTARVTARRAGGKRNATGCRQTVQAAFEPDRDEIDDARTSPVHTQSIAGIGDGAGGACGPLTATGLVPLMALVTRIITGS